MSGSVSPGTDVDVASARVSPVLAYLRGLHDRFSVLEDGDVATYIPELALSDPAHFGICLVTLDGALYEVGDTQVDFTIQSMSKPLTYGLALDLLGDASVHQRLGVEPSGDPFNEISLAPGTGAPMNPMINAGAIACAGLVAASEPDPLASIVAAYSRFAGRPLEVDEAVYRSERDTGHRNRAIAHLLESAGVLGVDPALAVDLYFRQCAVSVDCRDLAVIAATLANGGINPLTGKAAVSAHVVRQILSVMTTCGMYDAAGDWLVSVGIPAKSGVSGGVFAVVPGRIGIGVYSPRLDAQGNSVRGVALCRALSKDLEFHLVRPGERLPAPIRAQHHVGSLGSKRVRSAETRAAIAAAADSTAVFELQGELGFMAAEAVSRSVTDSAVHLYFVVVDLRRVARVDPGGIEMLRALQESLRAAGGALAISGAQPEIADSFDDAFVLLPDLDSGLEWCEEALLERLEHPPAPMTVPLADHELLAELEPGELERLMPKLGQLRAGAGETIVRSGDSAADVFVVTHGSLSVRAPGSGPQGRRLSTVSAGMTFGELGYLQRGPRTADVHADTEVECRTISYGLLTTSPSRIPACTESS